MTIDYESRNNNSNNNFNNNNNDQKHTINKIRIFGFSLVGGLIASIIYSGCSGENNNNKEKIPEYDTQKTEINTTIEEDEKKVIPKMSDKEFLRLGGNIEDFNGIAEKYGGFRTYNSNNLDDILKFLEPKEVEEFDIAFEGRVIEELSVEEGPSYKIVMKNDVSTPVGTFLMLDHDMSLLQYAHRNELDVRLVGNLESVKYLNGDEKFFLKDPFLAIDTDKDPNREDFKNYSSRMISRDGAYIWREEHLEEPMRKIQENATPISK